LAGFSLSGYQFQNVKIDVQIAPLRNKSHYKGSVVYCFANMATINRWPFFMVLVYSIPPTASFKPDSTTTFEA